MKRLEKDYREFREEAKERTEALEMKIDNFKSMDKPIFRFKEAISIKPKEWDAQDKKYPFSEFAQDVKNWSKAMHDDFKKIIEMTEKVDIMDFEQVEDIINENVYKDMDRHLWQILVSTVRGPEAKSFLINPVDSGFKAWKQLTGRYHSRTSADKITAMRRLISPTTSFGQPKDVNHSRILFCKNGKMNCMSMK